VTAHTGHFQFKVTPIVGKLTHLLRMLWPYIFVTVKAALRKSPGIGLGLGNYFWIGKVDI
jgi:hypothetical protein